MQQAAFLPVLVMLVLTDARTNAFFWLFVDEDTTSAPTTSAPGEGLTFRPWRDRPVLAPARDKYDPVVELPQGDDQYAQVQYRDAPQGGGGGRDGDENQLTDRQKFARKIRAEILEKLGLETAPSVKVNLSMIPDILLRPDPDYQSDEDSPDVYETRSPIRELTKVAEVAPVCRSPRRGHATCIRLTLTRNIGPEMVASAVLYVYKRGHYRVEAADAGAKGAVLKAEEAVAPAGWVKLDLTHTVTRWLHRDQLHSVRSRDIQIRCHRCPGEPIETEGNKRPFLAIIPPDPSSHRSKRRARRCQGNNRGCCLEDATFTMAELGLDFILRPTRISPNRCRGSCDARDDPAVLGQHRTVHASMIQSRMDDRPACCAPDKLEPLSVLYEGDDGYHIKQDLPDVIARSCGCH